MYVLIVKKRLVKYEKDAISKSVFLIRKNCKKEIEIRIRNSLQTVSMSLTRKEKTMSEGSVVIDTGLNNDGLNKDINSIVNWFKELPRKNFNMLTNIINNIVKWWKRFS